jgi:hypothetical protein
VLHDHVLLSTLGVVSTAPICANEVFNVVAQMTIAQMTHLPKKLSRGKQLPPHHVFFLNFKLQYDHRGALSRGCR